MWFQIAADNGQPVLWDYHVFCMAKQDENWQVLDLGSSLGIPVTVQRYLSSSFSGQIRPRYLPCFRVISAPEYLDGFSSDRSHMRLARGSYHHPPPAWPVIHTPGINNLESFIDMEKSFLGEVLSLDDFTRKYSQAESPGTPVCFRPQ